MEAFAPFEFSFGPLIFYSPPNSAITSSFLMTSLPFSMLTPPWRLHRRDMRLNLLTQDKLITIRQLRSLQKLANLPTTRLTRQVINSHAIPKDGLKAKGSRHHSTRCSLRKALEETELVKNGTGAPLKDWIPLLLKKDIGKYIEEKLGLPENIFSNPKRI